LTDALFVTTDDLRFRRRVGNEHYQSFCDKMGMYRTWGDCYGYVLVATGRADIMIDAKITIWDIAPLSLIIEEAGGKYSTFTGEVTHNGPDFVTTNGILHDEVLSLLKGK
jgi:fructose-1,6-bisphosphatase/inositol monophosphatase family enzyme